MEPGTFPTTARGRRTRAALLDAARSLLEEQGFDGLTMTAVAMRARLSRRTAYLHFASRSDLVRSLFGHVSEVEGLEDSTRPVWRAPDSVTALEEWARHIARYHTRNSALDHAIRRMRHTDPDAARYQRRVARLQLGNCRELVLWLHREGRLAPAWNVTTATDMLWALLSTEFIEDLVGEREWTPTQLSGHVIALFRATFTDTALAPPWEAAQPPPDRRH